MTEPRAYTAEEVRDMLLEAFRQTAHYWATVQPADRELTIQDRCEGVVHSILASLDGCGSTLPAITLKLDPHPDDPEFLRAEGSNWFEPGMEIADMLHEHFYQGDDK